MREKPLIFSPGPLVLARSCVVPLSHLAEFNFSEWSQHLMSTGDHVEFLQFSISVWSHFKVNFYISILRRLVLKIIIECPFFGEHSVTRDVSGEVVAGPAHTNVPG